MSYLHTQVFKRRLFANITHFCFTGLVLLTVLCNPTLSEPTLVNRREAQQTTSSLKRADRRNIEQLIYQADTAQRNDNYPEAEKIWQQIIQRQPDAIWARYRLAKILSVQGKNESAIALYRQIIQQAPKEATAYIELGNTLQVESWGRSESIAEKQLRQALPLYRQALELQPDLVESLAWWTRLPPEKTILIVQQDIQARPKKTAIDYLLLWSAIRNSRNTLESRETARQNSPAICQKYPETCRDEGRSNPKQEVEALQQAIQLAPKLAIAYEMLGLSQSELGEYSQAAGLFKQAIALNSRRARTYYQLAEMLIAQNRVEEAIPVLHQAVQVEPDTTAFDTMFWWSRNRQPVVQLSEALIRERPNPINYYILGNLFASRQFTLQAHPRYLALAFNAFQTSIKLDPSSAKAHERLGYVLAGQKKLKEAEAAFRKAIQINPRLKVAYTNLRNVLRAQEKFDDAFQVFLAEQAATL